MQDSVQLLHINVILHQHPNVFIMSAYTQNFSTEETRLSSTITYATFKTGPHATYTDNFDPTPVMLICRQRFEVPIQLRYILPTHKDPVHPSPPHKSDDMSIGAVYPSNQPPGIEDEPIDVDVTNPELSTDFKKYALQQEGIINESYERPGKEYLQESLESHIPIDGQKMSRDFLTKHADLDIN